MPAPVDPEERHWDEVRNFACGYSDFAGDTRHLCPADPQFPKLTDYDLQTYQDGPSFWMCSALPKTDAARRAPLLDRAGPTREAAIAGMEREYERVARRG